MRLDGTIGGLVETATFSGQICSTLGVDEQK